MAKKNAHQKGGRGVLPKVMMEVVKRKQWMNASVAKETLIYFRSPEGSSIQTILEGLPRLF